LFTPKIWWCQEFPGIFAQTLFTLLKNNLRGHRMMRLPRKKRPPRRRDEILRKIKLQLGKVGGQLREAQSWLDKAGRQIFGSLKWARRIGFLARWAAALALFADGAYLTLTSGELWPTALPQLGLIGIAILVLITPCALLRAVHWALCLPFLRWGIAGILMSALKLGHL
jgi:hypothetical protein